MATIYDIKKRSDTLSAKTDSNSILPEEVGGIIRDLADYTQQVEINGGSLGVRKVYISTDAMQADINPINDGQPLKRGNLVVIYDGTNSGVNNNEVYAWLNPGWLLVSKLDAGYATKKELKQAIPEMEQDGFFIIDSNFNVVLRYNNDGFDIAKISLHLKELLNNELRISYDQDGNSIVDTYAKISKINTLSFALQIINQMITEVEEEGFHVSDMNGNVGLKYNANGLDAAKLSQHFIGLLKELGLGGGKVDGIEIIDENCIAFVDANNNVGYLFSATGMLRIDAFEEQISDIDYNI